MNDTPDTSLIARLLGQSWKTTVGGAMAAAGGILATQAPGRWQLVGSILLAVGLTWTGYQSRDKTVSSERMDAAKPNELPTVAEIKGDKP